MEVQAQAKLNLTLDVIGKRPDGYHDLRMIMQSVALADGLTLKQVCGTQPQVRTNLHFLPNNEKNLAVRAALRWWEARGQAPQGLDIAIDKRIPVCAGMAGGSSDAAAVLRALNTMEGEPLSPMEVAKIGEQVGSDVPYCVIGGTALAEGRGERLTDLPPLPPCFLVVCKPACSVSTPELFGLVRTKRLRCHPDTAGLLSALEQGDLEAASHRFYNVFEDVLPRRYSQVFEMKGALLERGAMAASMTGSGPSVFGLFRDEEPARQAAEALEASCQTVFLCRPAAREDIQW